MPLLTASGNEPHTRPLISMRVGPSGPTRNSTIARPVQRSSRIERLRVPEQDRVHRHALAQRARAAGDRHLVQPAVLEGEQRLAAVEQQLDAVPLAGADTPAAAPRRGPPEPLHARPEDLGDRRSLTSKRSIAVRGDEPRARRLDDQRPAERRRAAAAPPRPCGTTRSRGTGTPRRRPARPSRPCRRPAPAPRARGSPARTAPRSARAPPTAAARRRR